MAASIDDILTAIKNNVVAIGNEFVIRVCELALAIKDSHLASE